ncbi:MAG: hypothetical protein ABEJ42_03765 [Halobacteriaceae archaeon]
MTTTVEPTTQAELQAAIGHLLREADRNDVDVVGEYGLSTDDREWRVDVAHLPARVERQD